MTNNGKRRVDLKSKYNKQYIYEGNAVRRIENIQQEGTKTSSISNATARNRARAQSVEKGYVVFLAAISAVSVFLCVEYLQIKAIITSQNKQIISLESTLNDLESDNDAYYDKVLTSVDVEMIKDVAINQLGMKRPSAEQVYFFDIDDGSYVRQYQDIPVAE